MSSQFSDSIVKITSCDPIARKDFGTGFIIYHKQQVTYLLTCVHVIDAVGGPDKVLVDGEPAKVVAWGKEEEIDLAVLQVDSLVDKPSLPLSAIVREGQPFIVSGIYKFDQTHILRSIRGNLGRSIELTPGSGHIRINAWDLKIEDENLLQPGYSGSPVIDQERGFVVGLVSHRQGQGDKGLAIAIETLLIVWKDIPNELKKYIQLSTDSTSNSNSSYVTSQFNLLQAVLKHLKVKSVQIAFWSSFSATFFLLILRTAGGLEFFELKLFDQFMRSRMIFDSPDNRIVVITITPEDVQAQANIPGEGIALKQDRLMRLLAKLDQAEPKVIGLDVYRTSLELELNKYASLADRLVAVCALPESQDSEGLIESSDVPPPRGIALNQVGFADILKDGDGVVRRHLMVVKVPSKFECKPEQAFSLVLAKRFLDQDKNDDSFQLPKYVGEELILQDRAFQSLGIFAGGYQGLDNSSHTTLLNYRHVSNDPKDIIPVDQLLPLSDVLDKDLSENIRGKIVLIGGVGVPGYPDEWETPYGIEISGVFLHAHMVSQILDVVDGSRRLLWVWSFGTEMAWIWVWSLLGGLLVIYTPRAFLYFILAGGTLSLLFIICYSCLTFWSGWIPLFPPVLGFVATSAVTFYWVSKSSDRTSSAS